MSKFHKYIKEKKMVKSTMIGFGVDESKLDRTIEYIASWFDRYKVPYEGIGKKHISVAMIVDKLKKDELVRLVNTISPSPFVFNPKKITVLHGRYDYDFIALELKKPKNYEELHNKIKDKYNVVEFQGGMRPHISLLKFPGGVASDEFMADVIRNVPLPKNIKAKKVELWGPKFQIDYSKK